MPAPLFKLEESKSETQEESKSPKNRVKRLDTGDSKSSNSVADPGKKQKQSPITTVDSGQPKKKMSRKQLKQQSWGEDSSSDNEEAKGASGTNDSEDDDSGNELREEKGKSGKSTKGK